MMSLKNIEIEVKDKLATIWLSQPEKRNALNPGLIEDIIKAFKWIEKQKDIMIIVIRGRGKSFCSGADLNWMLSSGASGRKSCQRDSSMLANFFKQIYMSDKVVINMVHGDIFGGGLGIVSAGDFTLALRNSRFRLPELQLGLVPSVIMPYLFARVNQKDIRYHIFSGEIFTADEALRLGLIDRVCKDISEMENRSNELISQILPVSPKALTETKKLLRELNSSLVNSDNIRKTIKTITKMKMSDDTRERMNNFFSYKNNLNNNK